MLEAVETRVAVDDAPKILELLMIGTLFSLRAYCHLYMSRDRELGD